ncbi:hypothetical protein Q4489_07295 [Thalassotalea sp. 1_MG-2023]|uniref:alpha/beta family hydrolase n=1 Tax=Thalassotalea sp. 1_MG-2023 TaxID=3062680 RepID=UPI0026E36764|nr:alpha/beta family hydrolase [Thalassotalea sp. 1_MG-2023]MDO6426812.1 hypothetical protein [Thalassotalea sp. 1_MG-2023]
MKSFNYNESLVEQPIAHFLFAHGAGADMNSTFMENMTTALNKRNISVTRFNFHYMDKRLSDGKKYPPDRMPKLLERFAEAISTLHITAPLFLLGKSMGSRVAATLTNELIENPKGNPEIRGVICLGYPFHPINKIEQLRLEPLINNHYSILILQGDRDKLGNKEEVLSYELPENITTIFLPDGDHDLKPRVKSGYTHEQNLQSAVDHIERFVYENR